MMHQWLSRQIDYDWLWRMTKVVVHCIVLIYLLLNKNAWAYDDSVIYNISLVL